VPLLCLLPLSGHGGEDRKRWAPVTTRSRGGEGVAASTRVRVAEGRFASGISPASPFPACCGGEGKRAVVQCRVASSRSFFKCILCFCSGDISCDALAYQAGRVGGEVGKGESADAGAGGGLWEPLEIRLMAALTLRRPCHAAAIQGQKVGCACSTMRCS
jgi:hypothetical protein